MDVQDKLEETDSQQIAFWAQEYAEVFDHVRNLAESDMHAWFIVWEFMRYWEAEEARKKKGPRSATDAQLLELKGHGIMELGDLSQKEAVNLLNLLKGQDAQPETESAEEEPY